MSQMLETLYKLQVQSILIEGGAKLLLTFFDSNQWDEARVFTGVKEFKKGLKAPQLNNIPKTTVYLGEDQLDFFVND
jgi:diaminohydroxyphosphoribosylaminopyrimidine deaminase/5-amino-6-(5-phosphoribosylamino)uracil reductase